MKRLLRNLDGKFLRRVIDGRKLFVPEECPGPCCGTNVYLGRECCDGVPELWFVASVFECDPGAGFVTVKIGGLCYTVDRGRSEDRATIESQGGTIVESGWECPLTGCSDPACRTCPTECCILGFIRPCGDCGPGTICCNLGSAYQLSYREVLTTTVHGLIHPYVCTSPEHPDGYCFGGLPDSQLIRSVTQITTSDCVFANNDPGCSDQVPYFSGSVRTISREYRDDLVFGDCVLFRLNPRFEDSDTTIPNSGCLFGVGQIPCVFHPEGCNFSGTVTRTCQDNPNLGYRSVETTTIAATAGCFSGNSLKTVTEVRTNCGCPSEEASVRQVIVESRLVEYTITPFAGGGCEGDPCPQGLAAITALAGMFNADRPSAGDLL